MPEFKGILGEKLGMTQIFDDARAVPVTVIKAGPCFVAQIKSPETDGYSAVQLAFGDVPESKINKPTAGHFCWNELASKDPASAVKAARSFPRFWRVMFE